jgi:uncharacterized Zn finger protein (UPF0148 family)
MAKCPECGSEVAGNDIFCPYCGISLPQAAEEVRESDESMASTIMIPATDLAALAAEAKEQIAGTKSKGNATEETHSGAAASSNVLSFPAEAPNSSEVEAMEAVSPVESAP